MNLNDVINETNIRVPNTIAAADKVTFLNEINQEFFSLVKIPLAYLFNAVAGTASYPTVSGVRAKNISLVNVGTAQYSSFQYENLPPGRNYWVFNDATQTITLSPAPTSAGQGAIRYFQMPSSTYLSSDLNATPDAPAEYHHIYTLGLCAKVAKAIPDISLGNNYQSEYEAQLEIAIQNYARGAKA